MKRSNKAYLLLFTYPMFCVISCGGASESKIKFKTKKNLELAKSEVQSILSSRDVYDSMLKRAPSQKFFYLSHFYGFSYNFDMPGGDEWELVDGWQRPLRFAFDAEEARVWSVGSNGVNDNGDGDDIVVRIKISHDN